MIQTPYFFEEQLCVTGSELATSHKGTKNLDFACKVNRSITALCDCKVVGIYHSASSNANTVWFQSLDEVKTPVFTDFIYWMMSHMNDADFKAMSYYVGKVFKRGEYMYKEGSQGYATGTHVHFGIGRGKYVAPGWYKTPSNTWMPRNGVHAWEAFYLKPGTPIIKGSDEGYAYKDKWVYAKVPATMATVTNKGLKTTTTAVNVREQASTMYPVIAQLPINQVIDILEESTNIVDGFKWVKVYINGMYGYSAVVASVSIVDVLTPEQILQKKLDEANATIAKQTTAISAKDSEIGSLKTQNATLDLQVKSFVPIATPLYEKK